ncbi:hypothetical protein [Lentzea sp. NPDC051838]|uniref:hypothetical protein n=1 Tax=Lentzea sp. NPDC051838 TaxID=3154849 RepID=UPI003439DB33
MTQPLGVFGRPRLSPELLRPLVGELSSDLRGRVAEYLRGGTLVIALMEYTEDVLEGRFGVSGGSGVMTDGTYYWRCDAAEYVETYGIHLDQAIIDHMEQTGWRAPQLSPAEVLEIDDVLTRALRSV